MNSIKNLYLTQLTQLKNEIELYKEEANIWNITKGISNKPGNICLHICGNLNYFIGAEISKTGFVRDREKEFNETYLSKNDLLKGVDDTIAMIQHTFDNLKNEDFEKIYPLEKFGKNVTYAFIFARLVSHLSYHLGQINYHRRIIEN